MSDKQKEVQETAQKPDVKTDQEQVQETAPIIEEKPQEKPMSEFDLENRKSQVELLKTARSTTTDLLNPVQWTQMKDMSEQFAKAQALPKHWDSAPKIMVGLQVGVEMGMKPMEALNSLYIVNGSVNVWGKAIVRRLREHGYKIEYSEETNKCTAIVTKGDETYSDTMSFEDAEKSGYTKDNYGKQKVGWIDGNNRKLKLRYGAIANLIKSYIPEVLGTANDVVLGDRVEDYDFGDKQAVMGEVVEQTKPTIDDEKFKRFVNAGAMYVTKHKGDYEFTDAQQKQVELIVASWEQKLAGDTEVSA